MNSTHQKISKRTGRVQTTLLVILFGLAAARSTPAQSTDPLRTIIPVHFDASTGAITVGSNTYTGNSTTPGFHLLALRRTPDSSHLDSPDVIVDQLIGSVSNLISTLNNLPTTNPDAMLMVNAAGNYGFSRRRRLCPGLCEVWRVPERPTGEFGR